VCETGGIRLRISRRREVSPGRLPVASLGKVATMASRDTRREENQKRFRLGNERLHDIVEGQVPEVRPVRFLCECADDDCHGSVEVLLSEWEDVASQPNDFLIVAGHLRSEGEEVVGSLGEYEIVRKPG
jgi:hypothetical protein